MINDHETCPNGCDLETFGTHQGPPDCDLQPSDPNATLVTAVITINGQRRTIDVALSSAMRADLVRGLEVQRP